MKSGQHPDSNKTVVCYYIIAFIPLVWNLLGGLFSHSLQLKIIELSDEKMKVTEMRDEKQKKHLEVFLISSKTRHPVLSQSFQRSLVWVLASSPQTRSWISVWVSRVGSSLICHYPDWHHHHHLLALYTNCWWQLNLKSGVSCSSRTLAQKCVTLSNTGYLRLAAWSWPGSRSLVSKRIPPCGRNVALIIRPSCREAQ